MVLIFKLFLSLIGVSISSLFIASTLSWLELAAFASLASSTATFTWLSAYIIISLQTGFYLVKSTLYHLQGYFNPLSQKQRQLLFIQNKRQQLKLRHAIHRSHINYIYETKRLKLLRANNQKHTQSLGKTINQDLRAFKNQLAKNCYHHHNDTQNSDKLFHSQQRIANLKP